MKTLGLGKLVGRRTWGGGIWLSSDNRLVDGGLGGSAPEIGTYNNEWGWGLGIENMGVEADVIVDNNPLASYTGGLDGDEQLKTGIRVLAEMVAEKGATEEWVIRRPGKKKDVLEGEMDGIC